MEMILCRLLVILFVPFFVVSCKKKELHKQVSELTKIFNNKYTQDNGTSIEKEKYIYTSGDTIDNQYKYYNKKGQIIYTKSKFYKLTDLASTDGKLYKGTLHYFSPFDNNSNIKSQKTEFSFLQKKGDSLYYQTYSGKHSIDFEYYDFDKKSIYGFIKNLVRIDTVVNGKKMTRIIEETTLVDNTNPTKNPYDIRKE